ncbi:MAG: N-acetylmuramoyl-L-alanine amidase [Nitrospinae bacterium]|nr:N-acetylmuramoyl-L-alanine amidase [Nitrospinota bacterium]
MYSKLVLFLLVFLFLFLNGKGEGAKEPGPEELYKDARQAFYSHKDSGNPSKDRRAWVEIAALFKKVYERFPKSHRSDDALYTLARIHGDLFTKYKNEKDVDEALSCFTKLTTEYPSSRLADDAQLQIAEIFLNEKKDGKRALAAYEKILELFPEGDKLNEANKMIALLKKDVPKEANGEKNLVRVNAIRHWSNPTYTRVVIDLASALEFKEKKLSGQDKIYIDLYNAVLPEEIIKNVISVQDGLLKEIRASQYKPGVARVEFDAKNFRDFEVFSYEDPFRVVVDIRGHAKPQNAAPEKVTASAPLPLEKTAASSPLTPEKTVALAPLPTEKAAPEAHTAPPPEHSIETKLSQPNPLDVKRIVLDPGHGGKDLGATGYHGIQEKEIVLDIVMRLKKILLEKLSCKVVTTRDTDVYIPLEERTAIANTSNGDIFISVHGNSAPRKEAYGIETFFLSNALSERAMQTALRENMVATKEMSDDLRFILSDMLANNNMKESSELAGMIQKYMVQGLQKNYTKIKDLGAKGGPFYVLHGANMPSVLVEVAFLSNPMEAQRILDPEYRDRIALALYSGIKQYIQEFKFAFKSGE